MKTLIAIFAAVLMVGIAGAVYADSGTGDATTPAEANLDVTVSSNVSSFLSIGDPLLTETANFILNTPTGGWVGDYEGDTFPLVIRANFDELTQRAALVVIPIDIVSGPNTISSTKFQVRAGSLIPNTRLPAAGLEMEIWSTTISGEYSDTIEVEYLHDSNVPPGSYNTPSAEPMMRYELRIE